MPSFFTTYKSSQIHYYKSGTGGRLLLCFHGYGEAGDSFTFLDKYLGEDFTIIAIDLPFHGKTTWTGGLIFSNTDLVSIISQIRQEAGVKNSKLYLLGFSMGGRLALSLLQEIAYDIEKIVLLAPDGFQKSFWYSLATQNHFGTKFFHFTMRHPGWLFLLLNISNKFGLVNQSVFKFAKHYIHDSQTRDDLYYRWMVMRRFNPNSQKIKQLVRRNDVTMRLLYGKFDKVIRYKTAEKFIRGIESYCTLSVINSGHQLLQEKNRDEIIRLIKD